MKKVRTNLRRNSTARSGNLKLNSTGLKKNLGLSAKRKRMLIDYNHPMIPLFRQTALLGISRSSLYYHPKVNEFNLNLMNRIDEIHTQIPFYGRPKITELLNREGYLVNQKRVFRLMKILGIEAVRPKIHLSRRNPEHKIYPYLLRGMNVDHSDQVWATDITYIRMRSDFVYLVAIMDWFSRYVLSWELSNSLDVSFCVQALERALKLNSPEYFNSDQGSQFTSREHVEILTNYNIKISMDGRGRAYDNIFVERLWRTVKYEEVYLKDYDTIKEAREELGNYFKFYNTARLHASLEYQTPSEVYNRGMKRKKKGIKIS